MKKRILSLALSVMVLLSSMPSVSLAAVTTKPVLKGLTLGAEDGSQISLDQTFSSGKLVYSKTVEWLTDSAVMELQAGELTDRISVKDIEADAYIKANESEDFQVTTEAAFELTTSDAVVFDLSLDAGENTYEIQVTDDDTDATTTYILSVTRDAVVTNRNGLVLRFDAESGVTILEDAGYYFKDLNKNGELDPYEDWRLSSTERAQDLAEQMNLDQMLGLMVHDSIGGTPMGSSTPVSPETDIVEKGKRFDLVRSYASKTAMAEYNNERQRIAEAADLGIPVVISTDPRHSGTIDAGYNAGEDQSLSQWPDTMGMAATFDPDTFTSFGNVLAKEYRALGFTMLLGPQIDLITEPRWSRVSGSITEDYELNSDLASAYIDAMQTSETAQYEDYGLDSGWGPESVSAIAKHWPSGGNGENGFDAHRDIGKFGVYPGDGFEAAKDSFVEGAGLDPELALSSQQASGIMPYYTISTDQDPSGQNVGNGFSEYLVDDLLRGTYEYDGMVCTDWQITGDPAGLSDGQPYTAWGLESGKGYDMAYRFYRIIKAGCDQIGGTGRVDKLKEGYMILQDGSEKYGVEGVGEDAAIARIRQSAVRILRVIINLGIFENAYTDAETAENTAGDSTLVETAMEAHLDSVVMVKNADDTLPAQASGNEPLNVYIPVQKTTSSGMMFVNGQIIMGNGTPSFKTNMDVDLVSDYFNVTNYDEAKLAASVQGGREMTSDEKAAAADAADIAIVKIESPGVDMGDKNKAQNLQYGPYMSTTSRAQSIGGDWYHDNGTPDDLSDDTLVQYNEVPDTANGDYKSNRSILGWQGDNEQEKINDLLETIELMGDKPVIVILNMKNPTVVAEFEDKVDAILVGDTVTDRAYLETIVGNHEPNGLLPVTMPKSMDLVDASYEDIPDTVPYVDAQGNAYAFGFGMNWEGVISDARTAAYTTSLFPDQFTKEDIQVEADDVVAAKVEALINTMTWEEKVSLLGGGENPENIGSIANAGYLKGVPRLGVPEMRMFDGPTGVTYVEDTTGLPIPQSLASTWSKALANAYGEVMGEENRSISGNFQLGPQLDFTRTAHFGRSKDQLGEDPYLAARLAVEETKGVQSEGVIATLKHFAGFSQAAVPPTKTNFVIDEQTLQEMHFAAFEAAIKEGDAAAVMSSYNKLNGNYTNNSEWLLKGVLREQWNYDGLVMSDWGGNHGFGLTAGSDIEMPSGSGTGNSEASLAAAIENGTATMDDVDDAVRHVLTALGKVGYLSFVQLDGETGYVIADANRTKPIALESTYKEDVANGMLAENAEVSQEIAEKGAVLLKNNSGALPLKSSDYTGSSSVAMIGMTSKYLAAGIGGERSYGTLKYMTSPYDAVKSAAGSSANIVNEVGLDLVGSTIPAQYLYQDAAGTKPGIQRTYGIEGNTGTDFMGNPVVNAPTMMEGHEVGEPAGIAATMNYTVGTIDGEINKTYKNSANGTAFEKGSVYTWKGYLKAPESGSYRLILESIGGVSNFKISLDNGTTYASVGSTSLREGGQWPWNGTLVCTPEGMDISGSDITLEAGKLYPITVTGNASIKEKDLQLRLAWITPSQKAANYANAVQAAKDNDKVIFFAYDNTDAEKEDMMSGTRTISTLDLAADQQALLKDVTAAAKANGNEVIVVLNNSTPITMGEWIDSVDSVLEMWYPGQNGGFATANLLLGKVNPSGKTAQTFPKYNNETPVTDTEEHLNERMMGVNVDGIPTVTYTEGIFTGYRWYDKEDVAPLFSFGHGLSYTTYKYSDLSIKDNGSNYEVTFTVANTGSMAGDEIAQVYLGAAQNVPTGIQMAEKKLAAFDRISLQPGQSKTVTLTIGERELSYWDPDQDQWVLADSTNRSILVGASSSDIRLAGGTNGIVTDNTDGPASNNSGSHNNSGSSSSGGSSSGSTGTQDSETTGDNTAADNGTAAETQTPQFNDLEGFDWAQEAISTLADNGIINGVGENRFAPDSNIKRADFMLMLVRAFGLEADEDTNFSDVEADAYYADAVAIAKALEISNGTGDGLFLPNAEITRQDLMVLLYRTMVLQGMIDADDVTNDLSGFADGAGVADYAREAVATLAGLSIVQGSNGNILPNDQATRAEVAMLIYRVLFQK